MMPSNSTSQCAASWNPHSYQLQSVRFLLEHACAGLLLDPGLGKTSITLAALSFLLKRKMIKRVLLVAPLRVCYNVWPRESKKWKDFEHLKIAVLHGPGKEAALQSDADIFVINPEGLNWLLGTELTKYKANSKDKMGTVREVTRTKVDVDVKAFKKLGFDTLVIDELSKFKHSSSTRFKALKPVLDTFGRRWGLTGSPATNGLMDLFGQAFVLDLGHALGRFKTHYESTYFDADRYSFKLKLKPGAEDLIYEKIEPLMLRMGEELIDMPEFVPNVIPVQLPASVMKLYQQLEVLFLAGVNDRTITAANAAAASSKCRQVASGGVYLDREILESGLLKCGPREWANLHTEKVDALADLVDELQGSPLLVAYDFEHDLDRLRAAFPKATFACDFKAKDFPKVEDKWNRGEIEVLFGHPASIGHGLNLQGSNAKHVCWHSLPWDYDHYDQFNRRVRRQGNKSQKVFVHHIVAEGTLDELILVALGMKEKCQQALFEGIKAMKAQRKSRASS